MDKQIESAFLVVNREVVRIVQDALHTERLTREEWDKVNKLFEIFAEEIRKAWEVHQNDNTKSYAER